MKRTLIALTFVALCLAAQAQSQTPKPASKAQMAALKRAMEARLKDAESARYRGVQVTRARMADVVGKVEGIDGDSAVTVMCGQVNSKNSYGGYAGYSTFFATYSERLGGQNMDKPLATVIGIDKESGGTSSTMCRKAGIDLE